MDTHLLLLAQNVMLNLTKRERGKAMLNLPFPSSLGTLGVWDLNPSNNCLDI